MKLQKSTLYGVLAVLELAREPGRSLAASDIGTRYGISTHHLAKVLRTLGRAGLVDAVRGVGGGYRCAADVKRTTLLEVAELFEPVSGGDDLQEIANTRNGNALKSVLREIDDTARFTLGAITLHTALKLGDRLSGQGLSTTSPARALRRSPGQDRGRGQR